MDTTAGTGQLLSKVEENMKAETEKLKKEFGALRTGRANPQILDSVKVEYYGAEVPLKQVAAISVPEPRTLEISPWDPSALEGIEKALQKADVGGAPVNDGRIVRINLPAMTEDRRKNMAKAVRKMAEDLKIVMRNERRDALEKFKKAKNAREISEDDLSRLEGAVQKMTDANTALVDQILAAKEKELLTV